MTDENSVLEPLDNKEKKSNSMGIIIAILTLLIWGIWLGVYFTNFTQKQTTYIPSVEKWNKEKNINQNATQKILEPREEDFAYKGNLEFNLDIPKNNGKMNLKIDNFQILSRDKWLQSRASAENFFLKTKDREKKIQVEIQNMDIITNEEKTYLKMEWDTLKNLLIDSYKDKNPKIGEFIKNIFSKEYVEVDNSKNLLELLETNDELIISAIKWIMSPNMEYYYQKYWINKKLAKKFFSKDSYKILFEETLRDDDKIYVKLKKESCIFATSFINKLNKKIDPNTNILSNETCIEKLENINKVLANSLYITQDKNTETIHYNGIVQLEITYWNGEISYINLLAPTISLKYKDEHLSINFTLIIPWINTSLKIEQDFKDEYKWSIFVNSSGERQKLSLQVKYTNGIINNWSLNGSFWNSNGILKYKGSWDSKKWKLYYQYMNWNQELWKWYYSYDNGTHLLSITAPDSTIKGKLINTNNNSNFVLNGKIWTSTTINTKGKVSFGNNSLDILLFNLSFNSPNLVINSKINYQNNKLSTNIIINNKETQENYKFTANGDCSKDKINIIMWLVQNDKKIEDGTIDCNPKSCNIEISDLEEKNKLTINTNSRTEWNKIIKNWVFKILAKDNNNMYMDWKLDYSKDWIEYFIPTNAQKIDIPGFSKIQIPNLTFDTRSIKNKYIIVWWIWVVGVSSVSFFMVMTKWLWKSRDMRNQTILNQLITSLKMYYTAEWEYPTANSFIDIENIKEKLNPYMNIKPSEAVKWKIYYYMSLKSNGTENWAAILATEMEDKGNCNFEANNIEELQQIIKNNNYEYENIIKLIKPNYTIKTTPCFYVIFSK